jgi:hypothetical protein
MKGILKISERNIPHVGAIAILQRCEGRNILSKKQALSNLAAITQNLHFQAYQAPEE